MSAKRAATQFIPFMFLLFSAFSACAEETIGEIVDRELTGWPAGDRERVRAVLEGAGGSEHFSAANMAAFLRQVAFAHGTPPVATSEGAEVVVATFDAARTKGERTLEEEARNDTQFVEALSVGEAWLETHRAWFPDDAANVGGEAFKGAIGIARTNPLNLGFQEALPDPLHADVLARWQEELAKLDALGEVDFRQQFGVFLLNEASTPSWEWQRNEEAASAAALGILQRYLSLRHEIAVERLPQFSAVKVARNAVFNARMRAEQQTEPRLYAAGFQVHEALLEQEVLWLAQAALEGQTPFTLHAEGGGAYNLHAPMDTPELIRQEVTLKYNQTQQGTSGVDPSGPHDLKSALLIGPDCRRFEILARTPSMAKSALFIEPVGWTLVREPDGLVWLPGYYGVSRGLFRAALGGADASPIDRAFHEWGLKGYVENSLFNLTNVGGGEIVSTTSEGSTLHLEVRWPRQAPWFYLSRIERAEYVLQHLGGDYVLDYARLFDAATGTIAAKISWRNPELTPDGTRFYGEVVIDVQPIALSALWRVENRPIGESVAAPERSIVYRFSAAELGGVSCVVPEYFAVRGPEQVPLVEMTFDAPVPMEDSTTDIGDPLATLPVPQETAPLAFYSTFKDYYYRYLASPGEGQLKEVGDWIDRFSRIRDLALAQEDTSLALRAQLAVNGATVYGKALYPEWKAEFRRALDMVDAFPDRDVAWDNHGILMQKAYSAGDPEFAREVERRFTQLLVERFSAAEAFGRGRDYGLVYALSCFSAVEVKSVDRSYLVPAAIGKADALAHVAKYVRNQQSPWEIAECEIYLNAARETLKSAEEGFAPGDPEEWRGLANAARQKIHEAEQFLSVQP